MTCRGIPGITCYPCEGGTKRLPLFFSIISHRATIVTQFQNPGAPTIPVNGMRASFFSVQNSTPPNGILLAFHPAGYLNYEELFFILRKLRPCNSSAGIEEAVTRRCCPRLPLYLYHSRFSISRNAFFTKCSFTGMKCRKTLPESKKLSAVSLCRFLTNRHEKGFPDGKPFQFTILHPVRM